MANKEFQKNNETLSPRHIAPKVLGEFNTLRDFLEHNISQGGQDVRQISNGGNISFTDILLENSKISGVTDEADLIYSGIPHKIVVTYVTCPTTNRKILLNISEKPNTGGKVSPSKKPVIKKISVANSLNSLSLDDKYDETYGGDKKQHIKSKSTKLKS